MLKTISVKGRSVFYEEPFQFGLAGGKTRMMRETLINDDIERFHSWGTSSQSSTVVPFWCQTSCTGPIVRTGQSQRFTES